MTAAEAVQAAQEVQVEGWQVTVLVAVVVSIVSTSAGWIGAAVNARKNAVDDRQMLIDQLQEERTATFAQLDAERAERRAEREAHERTQATYWSDKAASRQHVAELRAHIWAGQQPPPPAAPVGYIE